MLELRTLIRGLLSVRQTKRIAINEKVEVLNAMYLKIVNLEL